MLRIYLNLNDLEKQTTGNKIEGVNDNFNGSFRM